MVAVGTVGGNNRMNVDVSVLDPTLLVVCPRNDFTFRTRGAGSPKRPISPDDCGTAVPLHHGS